MDDFDQFNQPAQPTQNTNTQEDDLFGSGSITSTTDETSFNTFSNDQQVDPSWNVENDSNTFDNTSASAPSQGAIFGDDTLDILGSAPTQATSYDDNVLTNQSSTNELDSFSSITPPPTVDSILYNETSKQQSKETSSYDMFSNPVSASTNDNYQISSTETLSPLQAYNVRRQQEIAEKDAEENRKIEELRQQAKQDLQRWYQDRATRMEQQLQTIKHEEDVLRTKALEKSDKDTCDWAKIVRFLEFNPGSQLSKGKRDLNRMKASILHARRDKDGTRLSENGV